MKRIPLIIAVFLVVLGCNLSERFKGSKSSNSKSTTMVGNDPVEQASPTAAQLAAIANGQTVKWDQQGITWTMPANWKKDDARNETFSSGGGGAFLGGTASVMPTMKGLEDVSMKAMYDSAKANQGVGKYDEVKWLEIDGLRGVEFRESKPERPDDIRRLEWQAYRTYAGQTQMISLILSTSGANFPKHQDELYGILYSMKIVH